MRFMVMIMGDEATEAGDLPDEQELLEMGRYNEELVKAGVMLDGNGLHATSKGFKVKFEGGTPTVTDGPFAEAKEVVAGYWVLQCKSLEETVEWVKRCPGGESRFEIRQFVEPEDFGEAFTPELREREEKMRQQIEQEGNR